MVLSRDLYNNQITSIKAWVEFNLKCATVPFIVALPSNTSEECCRLLSQITENRPLNALRYFNRYCGQLPEQPTDDTGNDYPTIADNPIVTRPKVIYPQPTDIQDDDDPPPNRNIPTPPIPLYPDRPVTELPPTSEAQTFTATVAFPLYNHVFGCGLGRPQVDTDYDYCVYGEEPQTFWENLLDKSQLLFDSLTGFLIGETVDKLCDLAIIRLALPFWQKALFLFGCSVLEDLIKHYGDRSDNISNFRVGGKVILGNFNVTTCDTPDNLDSDDLNDVIKDCGISECFIPLATFGVDNEHFHGLKNQLQIIFRAEDYSTGNHQEKRITISSPKLDVTDTDIKLYIPQWLRFGHTRYNAKTLPYGELRYYGITDHNQIIKPEIQAWFDDIAANLIEDADNNNPGSVVIDSLRDSNKARTYSTGWFYPNRFFVMGFDDEGKEWICKSKGTILRNRPSVDPPASNNTNWKLDF